jgi:hypothetical protein
LPLSQIAAAFAASGHHLGSLFAAVEERVLPSLQTLNTRDLATLLTSFVTAGHGSEPLFDAIASQVGPIIASPPPYDFL